MTLSGPSKKIFLGLFAALVILHAFAVSGSRLLPFTDLPNHLAASTIARHYGEFGTEFAKYYSVDLFPKPNVLHIAFSSLKLFPSAEAANRAWYFLYVILLPLSTLLLTRRLGGSIWTAALSMLLLYSYSVGWGFAGYTMGIPLVLLSLWASAGMAMNKGPKYAAASAALLFLLFFAHALAAIFAIVTHLVFMSFATGTRARRKAANCLAAVPAIAMLTTWWLFGRSFWFGQSTSEHLAGYYSGEFFSSFPGRWKILFIDNYSVLDGTKGEIIGAVFALVILAAALVPLALNRKAGGAEKRTAGPEGTRYALLFLIVSLACYLFLPRDLPGQTILAQRFSVFVLLSLAVIAGVAWKKVKFTRKRARFNAAPVVVTMICLAHLVLWWSNFSAFNRENENFTPELFPDHWKGKILSGLIYDFRWNGRPAYIHYPGYYIVWKKGIAATSLIGYRFGAVRRKAQLPVLPAYLEWIGMSGQYDGRYSSLDYLLVRGSVPAGHESDTDGFEPWRTAGRWQLLKNN